MPKATPSRPTIAGSPSPEVVSAALAALQAQLADERAAHRATEAALGKAEAARQTAEARAARLEAENTQSAEQISRLEHLNKELRKALFGPRSEKLGEDERQLSFEEFWAAIAEAGGRPEADDREQDEEAGGKRRRRSPRGSRSGVRFGPQVDRRQEVIEPDTIMCPCGCGEMTKIGEDRSERLDYEPAKFTVIETVRPRYACNKCKGGGVVQASASASLVEGGLPTEALLAHVLIAKYGDHLPLYRSQIYRSIEVTARRWRHGWAIVSPRGRLPGCGVEGQPPGSGRDHACSILAAARRRRATCGPRARRAPLERRGPAGASSRYRQVWRQAFERLFGDGAARRLLATTSWRGRSARRPRDAGSVLGARSAQAERGVRLERFADRAGRSQDRQALCDRGEDPGRGADDASIRWEESAPTPSGLARRAALAGLTALPSRRELAYIANQWAGCWVPARRPPRSTRTWWRTESAR